MVGAVTGGVLSAQDSDCAPSGSPRRAVIFGAAWGAIRGALGWDISDDRPPPSDTRDSGGGLTIATLVEIDDLTTALTRRAHRPGTG